MKKYIPLIFTELYLLTTIAIFFLGPVEFKIHNKEIFTILIFLYHAFFILGFILNAAIKTPTIKINNKFSVKKFYLLLFLGVLSSLIAYKNVMLSDSLIPYNIFQEVGRGLSEPGLVYAERMQNLPDESTAGSRAINIAAILFSFSKLFFIFYFLFFWKSLTLFKKAISFAYPITFITPGIASGTNSFLFIFVIFSALSLICIMYTKKSPLLRRVIAFSSIAIIIPISYFGHAMSQRGGGFEYFASTSPLGDISTKITTPSSTDDSALDFFTYTFTWLDYYLTQGYYGFSLILNLDHDWTYGFGNSAFLQRQLEALTGINITDRTFQSKISHLWDKDAQWHSFYSQFANDFGIVGLCFLMLALGAFLSAIWKSVINNNSLYGAALLPIFMLMIIFMPANNQVFGYIDTLSYFIVISALWISEGNNLRKKNV